MKKSLLPSTSSTKTGTTSEVSLYTGELTREFFDKSVQKLTLAFPALQKEFYLLLFDSLKRNGVSDDRLKDAVNHVIDTCPYPNPAIANFIAYDQKVETFTYPQLLEQVNKGFRMDDFIAVRINQDQQKPVFIHKSYDSPRFEKWNK